MTDVLYRYTGKANGPHVEGVPRRDLTAKDMQAVDLTALRDAVALGLYREVKAASQATTTPAPTKGKDGEA